MKQNSSLQYDDHKTILKNLYKKALIKNKKLYKQYNELPNRRTTQQNIENKNNEIKQTTKLLLNNPKKESYSLLDRLEFIKIYNSNLSGKIQELIQVLSEQKDNIQLTDINFLNAKIKLLESAVQRNSFVDAIATISKMFEIYERKKYLNINKKNMI